jgi:hypothetical protein
MTSRRTDSRCRRSAGALLLVLLVLGCQDGSSSNPAPGSDSGTGPGSPEPRSGSGSGADLGSADHTTYYRAYLDETLRGDFAAARDAYHRVVDDRNANPEIAARAALRLAEYEADLGRRHIALDLVARAAALGRDQRDLLHWAERLQKRLAAVRKQDIEVRGPRVGTALEGVSAEAVAEFARAETLLAAYHARRLRPRLEDLRAGVRSKRGALEAAARAYRQVVALGEPAAVIAAEFRIASLYYDLALSLTFDLPPELEPSAAAEWRQTLRARALADRDRARAAYLRALEAGRDGRGGVAGQVWYEAAELGLRSVEDLLRGRD